MNAVAVEGKQKEGRGTIPRQPPTMAGFHLDIPSNVFPFAVSLPYYKDILLTFQLGILLSRM